MSIQYDEKRDFIRMSTEHALEFREVGSGETRQGTCHNLSATGILFSCDEYLAEGIQLEVGITPQVSVVSPFSAVVEVIRSRPNGSPGRFSIAGRITAIK